MSEVESQDEYEAEAAPRRGHSKLIALVVVFVALGIAASWWGYSYFEAQKAERAQAEARAAAQKKTAQAAKQTNDDVAMMADLQRQKVAADEALRHAQEDRDRAAAELEQLKRSQAHPKRAK